MKVALIPMRVEDGNFGTNWKEFERRFKEALQYSPDFIVFPEYCLTGFREWDFSGAKLYDEIVKRVSTLAKNNAVYVIFGLLEPYKSCVYNSALLINREGEVILRHRKFQEPMKFCTGNTVKTAKTEFGKVAIIICGDLYNKRIAKWIRKKKPDFLFVPMEYSPESGKISEEDLKAMSERVKLLSVKTFIVNSYPPGGAWVFDESGNLLRKSSGDKLLIFDI
ncbi:carbon-nitrogen hydrolase [Thermococcus litoralis DSM 5473]|uniref:Carbon-nitrogen hydrolase n=1 Tax=Thermococcus litoralis (strain ATCC 51850 / DSM 5473 / JCM 8560 / NS-C) TaxID=523849 RepID=H3ZKK0_THELN|nr:carbon-nitrogen hydrolase family protein [Thermococcus litoralis]EHR79432.1 carbon-nitrogen hydrolase [Thermococcus litoralis DSM 5473]